jgi:dTDP-4-amino-4,6-dideoxygalactose transaminase
VSSSAGTGDTRVRVARPALPALERYTALLEGVWERGMLSNDGPCARAFEDAFVRYAGGGHALALSSADVALTLAIAALELPRGSRALLASFGFPSTMHALEWNGLQARFADVDAASWCLHVDALDEHLDGVSLIVATHMFGVPCDVTALERLALERDIALVFDAAQAAGTWVGDRHVTSFGDASVVSFGGTKIVTAGEGSIVVTRSERHAEGLRLRRRYGMDEHGISQALGLNGKLSELHAALALLTLDELDQQIAIRARLVDDYRSRLHGRDDVRMQQIPANTRATPTFFVVDLGAARDHVRRALDAVGIESRPYFPAMHLMARFTDTPRAAGLPVTERLSRGLLALPLYSELDASVVEETCALTLDALDAFHSVEG